jgi:hypothetical protein
MVALDYKVIIDYFIANNTDMCRFEMFDAYSYTLGSGGVKLSTVF